MLNDWSWGKQLSFPRDQSLSDLIYSGPPVNKITNGPQKFDRTEGRVTVLTMVFYKKMYGRFARWQKKWL